MTDRPQKENIDKIAPPLTTATAGKEIREAIKQHVGQTARTSEMIVTAILTIQQENEAIDRRLRRIELLLAKRIRPQQI